MMLQLTSWRYTFDVIGNIKIGGCHKKWVKKTQISSSVLWKLSYKLLKFLWYILLLTTAIIHNGPNLFDLGWYFT